MDPLGHRRDAIIVGDKEHIPAGRGNVWLLSHRCPDHPITLGGYGDINQALAAIEEGVVTQFLMRQAEAMFPACGD